MTRSRTIGMWVAALAGYRRAGWYAFDLFDNDGIPSAETLLPEYQQLEIGQVIASSNLPTSFNNAE